jgi:hypothetical protein
MLDSQQRHVYDWIEKYLYFFDNGLISWELCKELVKDASSGYPIRPPKLVASKLVTRATSDKNSIDLPPWAQRRNVILHELAHTIVNKFTKNQESHGPLFVSVFMNLLHVYCGFSYKDLYHTAHLGNVRWSSDKFLPRIRTDFTPDKKLALTPRQII